MYKKELDHIVDASKNNALTFFVGSGISAISNAPTWKELTDEICKTLGRKPQEKYSSDDYLQLPQKYYYSINQDDEEYYKFIKKHIIIKDLKPNQFHRELLNLTPTSFITTNYDTLIEDAAVQFCQSFKVVSQDSDIPLIYGDRFILKMHGDFQHNNIVLKEEDYLNYSENYKLIETLAKSVFSTNTVVFIGYSLNDYNIKLILNWTKSLLKDDFIRPYFVYTGKQKISADELLYHESKGLSVIDCNRLDPKAKTFYDKYKAFFDAVKANSQSLALCNNEERAFDCIYDLLCPLDKLRTLRISDIASKFQPVAIVEENGVITVSKDNALVLNKLIRMCNMSSKDIGSCKPKDRRYFNTIISVLKKARIRRLVISDVPNSVSAEIEVDIPFADEMCIMHDYHAMLEFCKKKTRSLSNNYYKAFYFSRLKQYDDAYFLFAEVAQKAYKSNNLLLYYLAKSNCISLEKIIKNVNRWHNCYDADAIDTVAPTELEIETLFSGLPTRFRSNYSNLKDLYSPNMLYKYSYNSIIDYQKLLNVIESGTVEFGASSSGKVILRINDYLHFLLGNGIIADEFSEYKNTVKTLMSGLLYKYSIQEKEILHTMPFEGLGESKVFFDEIDFHCLIEYFSDKELINVFRKYGIKNIEFQNTATIEQIVDNIINYYDYLNKSQSCNFAMYALQFQIKTMLALLRYVDVSQALIERIVTFIMKYDYINIMIDDKIKFLHHQLIIRNNNLSSVAGVLEDKLVYYMDLHIDALVNNGRFDLPSASNGINYYSLAGIIKKINKKYVSLDVSKRVSSIIRNNLTSQIETISKYYYNIITPYQKRKFVSWVKSLIREKFNFQLFTTLVICNSRIEDDIRKSLKDYLHGCMDYNSYEKDKKGVILFPRQSPIEDLESVGYWCLIGVLDSKEFSDFLGISQAFDLYSLYGKGDYSDYDVARLIDLNSYALKRLARNKRVRKQLREAISKKLKDSNVIESDKKQLQTMLVEYFC